MARTGYLQDSNQRSRSACFAGGTCFAFSRECSFTSYIRNHAAITAPEGDDVPRPRTTLSTEASSLFGGVLAASVDPSCCPGIRRGWTDLASRLQSPKSGG